MSGYASRDPKPLGEIAIIDQATIDAIAAQVPGGGLTIDQIKADTSIADAITKKHAIQDLSDLVVKVSGKSLIADITITDLTDGGETTLHTHAGGGVQVQTDWNATTGLGELLNKPTIPVVRRFANLAAPVVTSGTTEKVLFQMVIPPAWAVVGSTFRAWIIGNSSSTGTLIFKVRCGAGGTITDTIDWTAVTSAAQVANARAGFEVLITVRSATTIAVHGVGYAGAIQLPTVIAVPATPAITISGTWWINLTVICSSGTFTAQVATIEEVR